MTTWKMLSIYTSAGNRSGTRPLHAAIIATALEESLYSAFAVKSMEGFGPQLAIPTANRMAMDSDLPIEVRIMDEPAAIEAFLEKQTDLLAGCIITVTEVEIFQAPATMAS